MISFAASLAGAQLFIHLLPFFQVTYFPFTLVLRLAGGLVIEGEAKGW